jgi:hypothetical protein
MEKKNSTLVNSAHKMNRKDLLLDVPVEVGTIQTRASSAKRGKFSKSKKKPAKDVQSTSLNKRDFVLKFTKPDTNIVWPREMKIVNSLLKIFPNDLFWNSLTLRFQLNSLCWFLSDEGRKILNTEYKKFIFEPEKPQNFVLENNNIEFQGKIGETVQAPMTVREFLNLWQKKK